MRNKRSLFVDSRVGQIGRHVWLAVAGGVAIVLLLSIGLHFVNRNFSLSISENKKIELTPTQIRAIESIGEWEFLTITDEELVDTLRHGFFGDSELVRIYYGTLRLGFDLKDAAPGWLKVDHDTVKATLPPIRLLDKDFIDEAKTRPFHESGTWDERARGRLYAKAYRAMLKRCMTPANIRSAEENAGRQFDRLLTAMGFSFVQVRFQDESKERR